MRKSAAALAAISIALACSTTDLSDLQGGEPDASGGSGGSAGSGDASAGSAGTSGSGASAGNAGQGGSGGVSGSAGAAGSDAGATCKNPYAGSKCADLGPGECADCAIASCCSELETCFATTSCGGLYECYGTCQTAADPSKCIEDQCAACTAGTDLFTVLVQCLQDNCAVLCGGA